MSATLIINEKETLVLSLAFFDETGAAVVPATCTYRIDDLGSGTAVLALTSLTGLASTMLLEITSAQNAMVGGGPKDQRRVTFDYTYGSGGTRRHPDEYFYQVKNLGGVS